MAIDPALESLVMRCRAKDPAARPADAGALLAELEGITPAGAWTRADAARFWTEWSGRSPSAPAGREGDSAPIPAGGSLAMGRRPGDTPSE